jgi:hypothetical protein
MDLLCIVQFGTERNTRQFERRLHCLDVILNGETSQRFKNLQQFRETRLQQSRDALATNSKGL